MTVWRKITAPNRINDWSKKGTEAFNHLAPNRYIDPPIWTIVRQGEVVDEIYVEEGGRRYTPGASAELGSSGAPDTFGVARLGDRVRVVWHYQAFSELRTFTVGYRFRGLSVAYDDVVDVNLKVWGDE